MCIFIFTFSRRPYCSETSTATSVQLGIYIYALYNWLGNKKYIFIYRSARHSQRGYLLMSGATLVLEPRQKKLGYIPLYRLLDRHIYLSRYIYILQTTFFTGQHDLSTSRGLNSMPMTYIHKQNQQCTCLYIYIMMSQVETTQHGRLPDMDICYTYSDAAVCTYVASDQWWFLFYTLVVLSPFAASSDGKFGASHLAMEEPPDAPPVPPPDGPPPEDGRWCKFFIYIRFMVVFLINIYIYIYNQNLIYTYIYIYKMCICIYV